MIIASHAVRRFIHCAALWGAMLMNSCRHQAPVARHFLRMPAAYASGLSSIQRAQWLKQNRRNLPDRKSLTATGHLVLPEISTLRGTVLRGVEVLHVAATAGEGGLAVITKPGDNLNARPRLNLLTYDHSVYADAVPKIDNGVAPASWRIDPARKAITGYSRSGSGVTEMWWSGSGWSARKRPRSY